jgi:tRNA threonylcarbamoyladenosine biosynthesis protein TsaE
VRIRAAGAHDTEALGARLATVRPELSGRLAIVYLEGELGAGKTTFARGVLRSLGVAGEIRSPSYTLLEPYSASGLTLVHLDLYRLRSPEELDPLGLRDFAQPGHLWLIEWPERGSGRLPPPDLEVRLAVAAEGHSIELVSVSSFGESWLRALENAAATP